MRAFNLQTYHDYWDYLKDSLEEQQRLRDELTINVTEFFRDNSAYQELQQNVLPIIISEKVLLKLFKRALMTE